MAPKNLGQNHSIKPGAMLHAQHEHVRIQGHFMLVAYPSSVDQFVVPALAGIPPEGGTTNHSFQLG